jgi:hypothetical protein
LSVQQDTERPWHSLHGALGPFVFYDVWGKQEIPGNSQSLVNEAEADVRVSQAR